MRRDSRLSMVLHALLHMAEEKRALTSEQLADQMDTNAAVMRRTMAGLREAGIVSSEKGHGGGWTLVRELSELTLGQVYEALGSPTLFAIGQRTESPGCLVEQAVNRALGDALDAAEALLIARFRSVSMADLAADVARRMPPGARLGRPHGARASRARGGSHE